MHMLHRLVKYAVFVLFIIAFVLLTGWLFVSCMKHDIRNSDLAWRNSELRTVQLDAQQFNRLITALEQIANKEDQDGSSNH